MPEARARTIFAPRKLGTGFGSGIRKFEAGPKTSIPTFGSCSRSTRGNLPKQAGGSPPLRVVHVENASVLWVMRLHAQSSRLVTVHSVVRPANRHAFGNRTSWQSPGARPGRYCSERTRKLLWHGHSITRSLVWNEDMNRAYEGQKRAPSRAECRV